MIHIAEVKAVIGLIALVVAVDTVALAIMIVWSL